MVKSKFSGNFTRAAASLQWHSNLRVGGIIARDSRTSAVPVHCKCRCALPLCRTTFTQAAWQLSSSQSSPSHPCTVPTQLQYMGCRHWSVSVILHTEGLQLTQMLPRRVQWLPSPLSLFALASTGGLWEGLIPVRECHAAHKPQSEINPPHNLLIANLLLQCFQACCGEKKPKTEWPGNILPTTTRTAPTQPLACIKRRFSLEAEDLENYYPCSSSPFYLGLLVCFLIKPVV